MYTSPDTPYNETFRSKSTTRTGAVPLLGRFRDFLSTGGALLAEVNLPTMKRTIAVLAASLFLFPSLSMAAGLNYQQASSIIVLLEAFGVNSATIAQVWTYIAPEDIPLSPPTIATTQDTSPQYQPTFGGNLPINTPPSTNTQSNRAIVPVMDDNNTLVLTANFEKGSDVRAHNLPNQSQTKSGSLYPDTVDFDVSLSSDNTPLNQLNFSVDMGQNSLTQGYIQWPGDQGQSGPPYTGQVAFTAGFSQPGIYPIVITATDSDGVSVSQTLTVTSH